MKGVLVTLKVQSTGTSNYRLGINVKDSKEYFKKRGVDVKVILSNKKEVDTCTSCGQIDFSKPSKIRKKGYDLNKKGISEWITQKGFDDYQSGFPTKLLFRLNTKKMVLTFEKKVN